MSWLCCVVLLLRVCQCLPLGIWAIRSQPATHPRCDFFGEASEFGEVSRVCVTTVALVSFQAAIIVYAIAYGVILQKGYASKTPVISGTVLINAKQIRNDTSSPYCAVDQNPQMLNCTSGSSQPFSLGTLLVTSDSCFSLSSAQPLRLP